MGIPAKARNRKYDIDRMMKDYLSVMANRAHYNERVAFLSQRASCGRIKLVTGWQRRLLMDLIFPPPPEPKPAPKPAPEPFVQFQFRPFQLRPRSTTSQELALLVQAQGGRCYLCGEGFLDEAPTREHVVPWARGGRNARNILAAHGPCNNRKAGRSPHPCETLFCEAIYARLEKASARHRRSIALAEPPA